MNSRGFGGSGDLGAGGGWTHSYRWIASSDIFSGQTPGTPTHYTVTMPNGGVEGFSVSGGACSPDFLGIHDQFLPLNLSTLLAYLVLPDGGMIEFKATVQKESDYDETQNPPLSWTSWYSYKAQAIIDPSGLRTSLEYDTTGRLSKVTEPAGRWLKVSYDTSGSYTDQITKVDAGYNTSTVTQSVSYVYGARTFGRNSYNVLLNANYSDATSATYTYQAANTAGNPLISTCTDVRYPGPMKNIAYEFKTGGFYGQLYREKHPNGTAVATLTISGNTRTETRGDGKTRKWTYNAALPNGTHLLYLLASQTDFFPTTTHPATTFVYGASGNLTSVTDPSGHKTSFTRIGSTSAILTMTHPLVGAEGTATVTYEYEDPATGYYLKKKTDELGRVTTYHHDDANSGTMRTTSIDYPKGSESFVYNGFNQVVSHTRLSGGVETYTYDSRWRLWKYTPPATPLDGDANPGANPTIYLYDGDEHLHSIQDPRGNVTSVNYNERGQLTSTINPDTDLSQTVYAYNNDGTLKSVSVDYSATGTAVTSYTYDDYKRLRTVTTPQRSTGDGTARTTTYYYRLGGVATDDYSHTDGQARLTILPSTKKILNSYDLDFRLATTTVGSGTGEAATTEYGRDDAGNVTTMTEPKYYAAGGPSWVYSYDARDRLKTVDDPLGNQTAYTYDKASNKKSAVRANGQTVTYDTYDGMNRLTQMTVTQAPTAAAVTHYTWTDAGKLLTLKDPKNNVYTYSYDGLDRLRVLTFPSGGGTEAYTYDKASNLLTFKNRASGVQTFTYDSRNREKTYSWSTGAPQPRTLTYDDASRVVSCNTTNSFINFTYFNDNTLKTQETWGNGFYGDGNHRTMSYTYDADGNRASIAYPFWTAYALSYTNRNQLKDMTWTYDDSNVVSYTYDLNGNLKTRTPGTNPASSFTCDALNRVTDITHVFTGATRTLHYGYDAVGRRQYVQRDGDTTDADGYGYGLSDQVADFRVKGTVNLSTGAVSGGTLTHFNLDAAGNRTSVVATATTNYTSNGLNQYASVGSLNPTYGNNGNLAVYSGWTYGYDSMKRLSSADKTSTGVSANFYYDGLGRQVTRQETSGGITTTTYSVWDGWTLAAEYGPGPVLLNRYIYAGNDLIRTPNPTGIYYYPDAQGSTVFLASATGALLEKYTYDLYGTPTFYNGSGTVLSGGSAYGVGHLFTGQQWYDDLKLYDLRNRAYHPGLGRFLQPDPIGFAGDPANLYRYVGNNPVNWSDPSGLASKQTDHPSSDDPTVPVYDAGTIVGAGVPFGAGGGGGGGGGGGSGEPREFGLLGNREYPNDPRKVNTYDIPASDAVTTLPVTIGFGTPPFIRTTAAVFNPLSGGNPYLGSAPFIAELGKGFDPSNMNRLANASVYGVGYPAAAAVALPVVVPALGGAGVSTWNFITRTAPYWWAAFRTMDQVNSPREAMPPEPPPSIIEPMPPRSVRPPYTFPTPPPNW